MMKTQVMNETGVGQPRLDRYLADTGKVEESALDHFPFTIGRSETADLPIDSTRVSRQHASIAREQDGFRVQDLGSTNGTFLNGERIDDAELTDGDILAIADVEFTFSSGVSSPRDTATHVMAMDDEGPDAAERSGDVLRAIRRLQETLTRGSVGVLFQPVASLDGGRVLGYEALGASDGCHPFLSAVDRTLLATECRLTGQLRRLERLVAVEQAADLPADAYVFLRVDASEMGAGRLIQSLARLREVLSSSQRLVIELPEVALGDAPHCREFRSRLKELDIALAYDALAAGEARILARTEVRPDFTKLNKSLVRGIHRSEKHQPQVESLIRAGRKAGAEVIAVGLRTEEEVATFRRLGCRFGQGDYYGPPQPMRVLLEAGAGGTQIRSERNRPGGQLVEAIN
jgi:EAL domain-containing protein (putative c-di-GMP-specific phosphodiesterase class I)